MLDNEIEITLGELTKLPQNSYILADMRGETAFGHGHIEGAVLHQVDSEYTKERTLIFYCQYGKQSIETAEGYRSRGYDAYSLSGGYKEWLISRYDSLGSSELERYDRQMILPQIGTHGQEQLKNARVLMIGAGGLGCPCGMYLAAAGVGKIGIADFDSVALSNMNRQVAHRELGINKAVSLSNALRGINDSIEVTAYPYAFSSENAAGLLSGYDFVIDCADSPQSKFLINDMCVQNNKPYCYGGVIGFEGQVMTVIPHKSACLRCIFDEPPASCQTCETYGIIGAAAGVIGCVQALEAIKYITSAGSILSGRMFIFDMLTMKSRIVHLGNMSTECDICSGTAHK